MTGLSLDSRLYTKMSACADVVISVLWAMGLLLSVVGAPWSLRYAAIVFDDRRAGWSRTAWARMRAAAAFGRGPVAVSFVIVICAHASAFAILRASAASLVLLAAAFAAVTASAVLHLTAVASAHAQRPWARTSTSIAGTHPGKLIAWSTASAACSLIMLSFGAVLGPMSFVAAATTWVLAARTMHRASSSFARPNSMKGTTK